MAYTELIGFIAATLTTSAFIPQAIKVYKTKHTKDISLWMFIVLSIGIFSWLIYGILLNSLPIILANVITLILSIFILTNKLKYG